MLPFVTTPVTYASDRIPYFHAESLMRRFARDVAEAWLEKRIDDQEQQWLLALTEPSLQVPDPDPARIDRLVMGDDSPAGTEMSAALLISHASSPDTRIYLSTLLYGLEGFNDRQHLLTTLEERFTRRSAVAPTLEYERLEGPVFEQRMLMIVRQQAEKLATMSVQLASLPTFHAVLNQALKQRIECLVPGVPVNPATHWVQIVQTVTETPSTTAVVDGQSLFDAALALYTGQRLSAGLSRQFLTEKGELLGPEDTKHYLTALSGGAQMLKAAYTDALRGYWNTLTSDGRTRREQAADALAEGLRQELLDSHNSKKITESEYRYIRGMLPPGDESIADDVHIHGKTLTLSAQGDNPVTLAGIFLFAFTSPEMSDLLLYCAESGLRRFITLEDLQEYFSSISGRFELLRYLPWNDQSLGRSKAQLTLTLNDMEGPLFLTCIDSIIGLQASNLEDAIDQKVTDPERITTIIDDALDIRVLVDNRLVRLSGDGRWFDDRSKALNFPVPVNTGTFTHVSTSWLDRVRKLDDDIQLLTQAAPGVEACARHLLNRYLAAFGDVGLDALNVQVRFIQAAQTASVTVHTTLISLLLERVTRHQLIDLPADSEVLITSQHASKPQATALLRPSLLNDMLRQAHARFPAAYLAQSKTLLGKPWRYREFSLDAAAFSCAIRTSQLRLELDMEVRTQSAKLSALNMFEQVLNRPVRSSRESFGISRVEVSSLALIHDVLQPGVLMSNAFILQRPSNPSGPLLFWCGLEGLLRFASMAELVQYLNDRLGNPLKRAPWLNLLVGPGKASVRMRVERAEDNSVSLDARVIDGHFIQYLQQLEYQHHHEKVEAAFDFALRSHFHTELFGETMEAAEASNLAIPTLNVLCVAIQTMLFEAFMPAWIKSSTPQDLLAYSEILMQYHLANDPAADFLYAVPRLKAFSRDLLVKRLTLDFPDDTPDPDMLNITCTQYIAAPVPPGSIPSALQAATVAQIQTLTQYALNHFSSMPGAVLSVSSTGSKPIPAGLTPAYLRALVRSLDVGAAFQALLVEKLNPDGVDFPTRQRYFVQQLPAVVREVAFQLRLEKQLSVTAYDYIESVVTMPDGIARQPVHGQRIILRPLQLVCAEDIAPDKVSGLYVIGPEDPTQGPVILHAIYHEGFSFREYTDQDSLCQDLRTSSDLQALVIERLEEGVRGRYEHGGFTEPHLPWSTESFADVPLQTPGPVSLKVSPVLGNALRYFFLDTVQILLQMAMKQTVTTAQADWKSFTYLMTLGVELGMSVMPGKLGALIALWQSQSLMQQTVVSLTQRRWGKALSELSAALAMLATSRQSAEDVVEQAVEDPVDQPSGSEKPPSFPVFSWRNGNLAPELKARLKQFEAQDIALNQLSQDALYNLYENPATGFRYAAVAGEVYQVRQFGEQWSIVSGETKGPNIRINDEQQWVLDIKWGLAGGGGVVTKIKTELTDDWVEEVLSVEASGMAEIRTSYRRRAVLIGQAHLQAKSYLENCLDNLNFDAPGAELDSRAQRIFSDFFGVQMPGEQLIEKVRKLATSLFSALMDASLSPVSSPRYVVGSNKQGNEYVMAFVIKKDPKQRIFLTERFFRQPAFRLKPLGPADPDFDLGDHYRAITLIHELSHLVNDTHDIAYLESNAPHLDLLAENDPYRTRLKSELRRMQQFLSHLTPPDQLFKRLDSNDQWQDLKTEDGGGKQAILRITGQPDLAGARRAFLTDADKRTDIILSNADSVALLLVKLGRRRYLTTAV